MEDGERVIEGDENLVNHATSYYKTLFGPDIGNTFPLDPSLWNNDEKVSEEDNSALIKPFTEEEIKFALFKMEKNKTVGPDTCWDIIRMDIVELFDEFHKGDLDVHRLNYGGNYSSSKDPRGY